MLDPPLFVNIYQIIVNTVLFLLHKGLCTQSKILDLMNTQNIQLPWYMIELQQPVTVVVGRLEIKEKSKSTSTTF